MKERFKFRVWFTPDYQEPEMIYNAEQTYDNRCRNEGSYHHESFGEILEDKDCIIMQCTGLKDENGKLIYEGDIVKTKEHNLCAEGEVFKIFYEETLCQFLAKSIQDGLCLDIYDLYEEEVIGNIYENPELLED